MVRWPHKYCRDGRTAAAYGELVSRVEPDDNRSDDHHRPVINRTLLVTRGQPAPLFEPVDTALHHVAPRVDDPVKDQRTARSRGPLRLLVTSLRNRVLDLTLPQHAAAAWIAVALISYEAVRTCPWSPASAGAWDADVVQDCLQLRTIMAMSRRDHDGEWSPAAVASEMKLGRQSATAAPKPLVGGVRDPFFSSARLRRCRAPLAW
jgi:hypothetical protein